MSLILGKRNREIKVLLMHYSPSSSNSKKFKLFTCDDRKIDFGSIAKAFGLDPSTLKLNGYFISRGVDLISSSVTWNSLLCFFSSKGLSTGKHNHDAVLVTGKLVDKGGHESQCFQNGNSKVIEDEHAIGSNRGNQLEDANLHKNKKLRENKSGEMNGLECKRKKLFEDVKLFKKLKINEDKSDLRDKVDELTGSVSRSQFTCSYTSNNLKRVREDEAIVAANYKRIR